MGFHHLVNTQYFREAALDFHKNGGRYTTAPRGSRDYFEYWEEQEKRCRYGYKVGDLWIPGRYYFQLNFCPMFKVPDHIAIGMLKEAKDNKGRVSRRTAEKIFDMPRFWEVHYEWAQFRHIAWHGGSFMGINSEGGKHIACTKTRGAGWSYTEAADGVYNYNFIDGSKSYYFAGAEPYLTGDGILTKVQPMLDWLNEQCPFWKKNRQKKNTIMHQRASYIDEFGTEQGTFSEIIGQVVDNPSKTRGKRGRKIVFEEGGSFPRLKDALEVALGSLRDGTIYVGQASVFGCVCAGTEVYTADGRRVLIEDLKQEDGILGYDGAKISKEPITWMQPPAKKECVEITLETGTKLRCSTDHPILSTKTAWKSKKTEKGVQKKKVAFKEAGSLTTQDLVAVMEEIPTFGTVSNPFAYTTGYCIGDGYYGDGIEVIVDNDVSLDLIRQEVMEGNINLKRRHLTMAHEYVESYMLKGPLRQYFKSNGMLGQTKQAKRFPKDWDEYDRDSLAKMIAGYYDADGNVKTTKGKGVSIVLSSVVKELLESTKKALVKFGIHSNLVQELSKGGYTEEHVIYRLYVNRAESVENFRKHIPVLSPNKQVPKQSKRVTKLLRDAEYHKALPYGDELKGKLLTGAVLYQVVDVKPIGEQYIYNLTAGTTHTYLANNIITHNTGGEEGPGIEGLEDIFYNPEEWDMLQFPNIWEEGMEGESCGYFVPCWRANNMFMDTDGNVDMEGAIAADDTERLKKKKSKDPKALDRRKAEYPRTPSESFQRLTFNMFPIAEIDAQIKRIKHDKAVQALIRHGVLIRGEKGVEFIPKFEDFFPVNEYPHKKDGDLNGCITIFERPFRDQNGNVPEGLYSVVIDPYYKEESQDLTSLFAAYVIKHYNNVDPISEGLPVACYIGRPEELRYAYEQAFLLADYYGGCKLQSEIAGGGQGIIDYARERHLLHRLEREPEMLHNKEYSASAAAKNASIFMNMPTEKKRLGLTYLADWTKHVRGHDEKGNPILNIHRVYDLGILQEMRKFNPEKGNFDRISAMIIAMFMLKEKVAKAAEQVEEEYDFYNRDLFGGDAAHSEYSTTSYA